MGVARLSQREQDRCSAVKVVQLQQDSRLVRQRILVPLRSPGLDQGQPPLVVRDLLASPGVLIRRPTLPHVLVALAVLAKYGKLDVRRAGRLVLLPGRALALLGAIPRRAAPLADQQLRRAVQPVLGLGADPAFQRVADFLLKHLGDGRPLIGLGGAPQDRHRACVCLLDGRAAAELLHSAEKGRITAVAKGELIVSYDQSRLRKASRGEHGI